MKTSYRLAPAIAIALGVGSPAIHSAPLPTGTLLQITNGVQTYDANGNKLDVTSGSYFGMDNDGNARISGSEKTAILRGPDGGIIIGATQSASGTHSGAPNGSENASIDAPWAFFGNTGMHFTATTAPFAVSGDTVNGVNLSGWRVTWNAIPAINMGTGAWNPLNCGILGISNCAFSNAIAQFTDWNGTNGGTFRLIYAATVPDGDPSGFGNVRYLLNIVGTVVNDSPTAANRTVNIQAGAVNVAWTPGAADPNPTTGVANTALTCSIGTDPSNGTASVASDCSSGTYSHDGGGSTSDSFTYVVSDGLSTATATVTVNISADPAPTAEDFSASAVGTTPASIDFTSHVSDSVGAIDWATLAVVCASGAGVVNNNDGTADYTGVANFAGIDTCEYTVDDDGGGTSNTATLSVSVFSTAPASSSGTFTGGTTASVPADGESSQQCIGGCFDFTVSGIPVGDPVRVILPLSATIPENARYRKYISGAWQNFVVGDGNAISSAASVTVLGQSACPPVGSGSYTPGLTDGHDCIQLTIVDGGANDADPTPGQIADPSGVALPAAAAIGGASGSSGCALASRPMSIGKAGDWLLVGLALAGLAWFRRRTA